jgi:hypothetical protein
MRFPAGGTISSSGEPIWISFPSTRRETGQRVVASCLRNSSIVISDLVTPSAKNQPVRPSRAQQDNVDRPHPERTSKYVDYSTTALASGCSSIMPISQSTNSHLRHDLLHIRRCVSRAPPDQTSLEALPGRLGILMNSARSSADQAVSVSFSLSFRTTVSHRPKIIRPALVCNTLVTETRTDLLRCSRPPSTTIIVPSSR